MLNEAIGEGKQRVAVIPVNRDISNVRDALEAFDTIVLLKVGSKLNRLVALLEEMGLIDHAVFLSYIGTEDERVETDLRKFRNQTAGYMSLILIKKSRNFLVDDEEEEKWAKEPASSS
jgi:precorrin-2/cobalt-factor-2 C20-methyltransferase